MYLIDAVTKSTKYTISGDVFGARPAVKGMAVDAGPGMNYHIGNDYGTPEGTRIYAPLEAEYLKTVRDGDGDGYGNYILLYLPQMDITLHLAHLNHIEWYEGKGRIAAGTYIGNTGNTGLSFGPHLHLGVAKGKKYNTVKGRFKDGTWINPSDIRIPKVENKPSFKEIKEDGEITVTVSEGLRVRQAPSLKAKQTGLLSKGTKKVYTHYVDAEGIRWVKLKEGGYAARRTLDNKTIYANARFLNDKPAPKPIVKDSKVSTTAKKDIFGTNLDPHTVNANKTFTVEQVGRNGNNNHVLLKEIMTWVDKATLKVM